MGSIGTAVGTAPGAEKDFLLDISASIVNGSIKLSINPEGEYRDRYYAVWINGAYVGHNVWIPGGPSPVISVHPLNNAEVASIFVNDAGDWPDYSTFDVLPGGPGDYEADVANRILFSWTPNYDLTAIQGDTQLSDVVISNAARGVNLAPGSLPTRGDLTYGITTSSGVHAISWYAGTRIVAQGRIAGNGSFTCNQMTGSTMTVTGVLEWTNDLTPGIASLEVCWPAAYYVYYSTSPVSLPSAPQSVVLDQNAIKYLYLSPPLSGASYYYTVLTVDDQGHVQTSGYPVPSPVLINDAPPPVTNLQASGTAAALTLYWTPGEINDEFTAYHGLINQPVNFGEYPLPAPIWRDFNVNSAVLPPMAGYAPVDRTSDVETMQAAMDVTVASVTSAFNDGETGFASVLQDAQLDMDAIARAYGQQVGANVFEILEDMTGQTNQILAHENFLAPQGLSMAAWQSNMQPYVLSWLAYVGSAIYGNYAYYHLNGQPGPGSSGYVGDNLTRMCDPVVLPGTVRIIVRAKNLAGVQETNDNQLDVTFDSDGNIAGEAPNPASIVSITPNGLVAKVLAQIVGDNANVVANELYLYAGPKGSNFNPNVPQAVAVLASSSFNVQQETLSWTAPGAGWYQFGVAAVSNGFAGEISAPTYMYLGGNQQITVGNLTATIQDGQ